jgi:hypothetical protein
MYTDEDLDAAVKEGIFTSQAVNNFRTFSASEKNTHSIDEENFRLVTSFNDIYVVIACVLVLISVSWFGSTTSELASALLVTVTSWGLAEYFVNKRHMALPAIVLLLSFLIGVFNSTIASMGGLSESAFITAGFVAALAAWVHWRRFQVPITVAGGTATAVGGLIFVTANSTDASVSQWLVPLLFTSGIAIFIYAMWWDSADKQRLTRKSDVAFWLHLLASPLIVHPVFSLLGIFDGESGFTQAAVIILLYISMAVVSVAIDRRAIMVSGLAYVLYALSVLFKTFGIDASSSAMTGLVIGAALLLLSVYWHTCRTLLFNLIPNKLQSVLPPLK